MERIDIQFDWITSDWHYSHVNISTYCPQRLTYLGFDDPADVQAMNVALVENHNRQVQPGQNVLVIGDLCMGKVLETLQWMRGLNGQIWVVPGNHDRMHSAVAKSQEKRDRWTMEYEAVGLKILPESFVTNLDGVEVQVNHFPFTEDHSDEPRFMEARPVDDGLPLVHGHLHDAYRFNRNQANVGIDAWDGRFLTPREIADWFRLTGCSG